MVVINLNKIEVSPGLYEFSSKLGWIVSERAQTYPLNQNYVDSITLTLDYRNNSLIDCEDD